MISGAWDQPRICDDLEAFVDWDAVPTSDAMGVELRTASTSNVINAFGDNLAFQTVYPPQMTDDACIPASEAHLITTGHVFNHYSAHQHSDMVTATSLQTGSDSEILPFAYQSQACLPVLYEDENHLDTAPGFVAGRPTSLQVTEHKAPIIAKHDVGAVETAPFYERPAPLRNKRTLPGTSCFYARPSPKRIRRAMTADEQLSINRLRLKGACFRCRKLRLKVRASPSTVVRS